MYIYNYHPVTGEYLGQSIADNNPEELGKHLIPAFATETSPPKTSTREVAVFADGKWSKQPDYRGVHYWLHGMKHEITEIGVKVPAGSLNEPPSPSLNDLRAAKLAEINAEYETRAQQVAVGVPASEVVSWPKQEAEARALKADSKADALTLRAMAASRGVPLEVLAEKVIGKADAYSICIGKITGDRQRLEDLLNAIDLTADNAASQIKEIKWPD